LKFLPQIFGSETSKQVKWVRNVRVDYKRKCEKNLFLSFGKGKSNLIKKNYVLK
jgi:hypothetical protein